MKLLVKWFILALAVLLVANLVPGIHVTNFYAAVLVALMLGLVNAVLRPLVIVLTLPVTILTLGLFIFVANAFLFWLVAAVVPGFSVDGFLPALVGSIAVSIVSFIGNKFISAAERGA